MKEIFKIFVINPGSTSTKVALFANSKMLFEETISHSPKELARFKKITDQKDFRKKVVLDSLKKRSIDLSSIDIVVGRGGLTKPVAGGIYKVTSQMLRDLKKLYIHDREHASNLGALIAYDIAKLLKISAITMDPVATDEMLPIARISGFPAIERKSLFHALNIKAVGRKATGLLKKRKNPRFVIVHMGGGISIACYKNDKIIDVNNAVLGMGPFTPQRAGSLPIADLVNFCFSGKFTKEIMLKKLAKEGGLMGYLGTDNMRLVEKRIGRKDKKAKLIFEAMAYQIAKEIGAYATVFKGKFDAIIFTGGLARSKILVNTLKDKISFLGKIIVFPGEEESKALASGGLLVLQKKVKPKFYR